MSTPILLTGEAQRLVYFNLGPWIIGGILDIFLQGALCIQVCNYYSWYREDKRSLKAAVAGLCLLTSLKSMQTFTIIWTQAIVLFGDLDSALRTGFSAWWQAGNPLMVAMIGFYVQTYFCYRLYVVSGKILIVAPIGVLFLFAFFATGVASYYIATQQPVNVENWITAHLSSVFAGDLLLSGGTAYFLIKSRRAALPETMGLISALIRLTFQTAAPAALCAMLNLIFAVQFTGAKSPLTLVFNMPLPKLYAISMMFTLNARRNIRATRSGQYSSSDGRPTRPQRPQTDVEMGPLQIYTQTTTEHHVDVRTTLGEGDNIDGDAKKAL
ncbi:hypothetical protein B0H13DRAFT_2351262 [Mycena leptocephala]|nr:hypothetical protein B0H13DRAFT_2351262 [Mycena leptocephala]